MEFRRFDQFTRSRGRATARRRLLVSLALSPFAGLGAIRLMDEVEAKKRNKRKKRKPKAQPNEYGCLEVNDPCTSADQCCSGICEGKKGKRKCRAHDESTCTAGGQSDICGLDDVACTTSFLEPGSCATTTGNAGYCFASGGCYSCATDADCQEAGAGTAGPYAACIRCADCQETGGTACAGPFVTAAISTRFRHTGIRDTSR